MSQLSTQFKQYADKDGFWLLLIYFLALLFRFLYFFQAIDNPFLHVPLIDEEYYVEYAKAIIAPTTSSAFSGFHMDPLYGYFLAAVYYLFDGNLVPARLMQIFVDGAAALLLFFIGKRLWSQQIGALAGILYALYPVAWFYDLALLKTSLTAFFLVAYSYGLICALDTEGEKPKWWQWGLLGIVSAIGVYLRGYLIFLGFFTALFIVYYFGVRNLLSYKRVAMYVTGVACVLASVGVANWSKSGQFMMLPGNSGITLYSANNPENPRGAYSKPRFVQDNHPAHLYQQYKQEAERLTQQALNRKQVSDFWLKKSLAYWFSSVDVLPNLLFNRFLHFVSRNEIANNLSYTQAAAFAPILMPRLPVFSLLLALGLPGLFIAAYQNKKSAALFVGLMVIVTTCLLFYASSRFRFPAVPILVVGSAYFIATIHKYYRQRSAIAPISLAVVLLTLSLSSEGVRLDPRLGDLNLAIAYTKLGKADKALIVLGKMQLHENDASQSEMNLLAKYFQVKGFAQLAAKHYPDSLQSSATALKFNATDIIALHNAGIAALRLGNAGLAVGYFEKSYELQTNAERIYWYALALAQNGQARKAAQLLQQATTQADYVGELKLMIARLIDELGANE